MKQTYCTTCGKEIKLTDKFCSRCGVDLKSTYWERQSFLKLMRDTPTPQPKHKQVIKRLKKLIHRENNKEH